MPKVKLNQGHYNEASDRCSCISKIIEKLILSHPAVEQSEQAMHLVQGAKAEIDAVSELLAAKVNSQDESIHDRTYWMVEIFCEMILCKTSITVDPKANLLAEQATEALWQLNKHMGVKHSNNDTESKQSKHSPKGKRVRK